MKTNLNNTESFTEEQSLNVIHEMIQTAKQRHNQDGILFIVWGWIMLILNFWSYFSQYILTTSNPMAVTRFLNPALVLGGLAFTIFYLIRRNRQVKTYFGKTLLFIWIGMVACLSILGIVDSNYISEMMNESNVPFFTTLFFVQMMIIGFTTFVTGLILNQKSVIFGGILFALLTLPASWLGFPEAELFNQAGWVIAFIIPGHIIYAKRNK